MKFVENICASGRRGLSFFLLALFVLEPVFAFGLVNEPLPPDKVLNRDQQIRQVLARLTFGARPADFERIKKIGVKAYIDEQLNPETIDDSVLNKRLEKLPTLMLSTPTLAEQYNPPKPPPTPVPSPSPAVTMNAEMTKPITETSPTPAPTATTSPVPKPSPTPTPKNPQMVVTDLQRAKLLRAVYSERQLNEMLVDFWENHFSVYIQKDAARWMMTEFDRDVIRPYAFEKFRDLLGATARSPAMLYYLDNWQSSLLRKYPATKDKPERTSGGLNENYARELMELHTLGVTGGYTQKDVQEVARCFTGWTIRKPNEEGIFYFNPQAHDNGEKIVLGQKIPAGGGIADGEKVLDILAKHPSTAKFIATKLARRFLGDNPPPAVVNQAAQVYLKTDGSIRETLRSIITSQAFFSPALYQTKIKSPFEFVTASLRITNAETDGNRPVLDWVAKMGQPLFGHITPEGFPEQSDEWLSSGSLLARFNFAAALSGNKIRGTSIDASKILSGADLNNPSEVTARLTQIVLQNEVSPKSKEALEKIATEAKTKLNEPQKMDAVAMNNPKPTNANAVDPKNQPPKPANPAPNKSPDYVANLLTLMLGTPEFQRK